MEQESYYDDHRILMELSGIDCGYQELNAAIGCLKPIPDLTRWEGSTI